MLAGLIEPKWDYKTQVPYITTNRPAQTVCLHLEGDHLRHFLRQSHGLLLCYQEKILAPRPYYFKKADTFYRVINTPASYVGGPEIEYRPGYWQSWHVFRGFRQFLHANA
jgi:hypothetical protein